jgi:trk system potassium uptake protein TrkH
MRRDVVALIVGWTLVALCVPLFVALMATVFLDDWKLAIQAFLPSLMISGIWGVLMLRGWVRSDTDERLRDREAFAAVALCWPAVVAIGALPFWLSGVFIGPFTDDAQLIDILRGGVNSWFESMSGFTTTGATVIDDSMSPACMVAVVEDCINSQPRGLLLWRSLTQWLGGMGIIMLGMLLLARVLGGGMSLARAELTGPSLSRLRPRIKETALLLWAIYLGLTILEMILLFFVGDMNIFDSINHGLTTMPSGGFSTHDDSIGYFDSVTIELIIVMFMILTGINFSLLYFLTRRQWGKVFQDEEFKWYFSILFVAIVSCALALSLSGMAGHADSVRKALFQIVSIGTSTGYSSTDWVPWPVFTHILLFFLMVVGACAGSTSGGLKILRINLSLKVAGRELERIATPNQVKTIRMNGEPIESDNIALVIGMLIVWVGLFIISTLVMAVFMPDSDFITIISVIASSLGNTGPALGAYGPSATWASMSSLALLWTSILMWFGRLELLTALILMHPRTWRSEEKSEEKLTRRALKAFKDLFGKEE